MTAIYLCEAEEKRDKLLKLKVYIINPECPEFYYSASFVLNLIFDYWDPAKTDAILSAPLYMAVPRDAPEPCNYLSELAEAIIEEATVHRQARYPVEGELHIADYRQQLDELPLCVFHVRVTDAKWISHVEEKKRWTSAALDCEESDGDG